MLELFATYSVGQIIIFIIILLLAIKEFFSLIDFFNNRTKSLFDREKKKQENDVSLQELVKKMDEISARLNLLTESDKDDIRGWIVEKYHYCQSLNIPIDSFTMDTIEKRYQHYKDEGGNSYITHIMEELRSMAKEDKA